MSIHPLALVSPRAIVGSDVTIGPFSIIEDDVVIGDGCQLASSVVIKHGTRLGSNNQVFEAAVLGGLPQHTRMPDHLGDLIVGSGNTIRECVTMHRALHSGTSTVVGDNNLFMVGAHVAHDCRVGSSAIFANNALLAGHVTVDDRAYVSGAVAVHQFCRIGRLAMIGGHARVVQDVPPFVMVDGTTGLIVGLNLVGLRRSGYVVDQISELKSAYRLIYRRGLKWADVLERLKAEFPAGPAAEFYAFLSQGTRGFVQERRMPPGSTLKLRRAPEEESEQRKKAG